MFILLFFVMKKIIGLLCVFSLFYINYSYWLTDCEINFEPCDIWYHFEGSFPDCTCVPDWWTNPNWWSTTYSNKCTTWGTYWRNCNKTCEGSLYDFKISNGNSWYFKSCCDWWKVYNSWGQELSIESLLNPNLNNIHCCWAWEKYDSNLRKCVCENDAYWKKRKCCNWTAYNWKTTTGEDWYYQDCGSGFVYKYNGSAVVQRPWSNDRWTWYVICWKWKLVTTDWRCVPCAWAASLSGISVVPESTVNCNIVCAENEVAYTGTSWAPGCCPGTVKDWVCHQELLKMWVRVNNACLIDGQCGLNIYRILWIRASDNYDPSVSNVASDVINAAISIMWTIVTGVFVVAGVVCSMNSISGKDTKKAMKAFVDSAVWMLMIWWSYAIIRLVQFLATAWS